MKSFNKIVLLAFLVCSVTATASAAEIKNLRIGSSSIGSGFYQCAGGISQLWQAKLPDYVSSAVTGSSGRNCLLLEKGDFEFAIIATSTLKEAMEGEGPFKKPVGRLQYVTSLYPMPMHIMVGAKTGIKSLSEFKGRRIDFNNVGSSAETVSREALPVWGVNIKDLKIERFGRSEFEEGWKNGMIEGHIYGTSTPNAMVDDLTRNRDVFLLTPEPDMVDKLIRELPHYTRYTIPGGTYAAYPQDIITFATMAALVTHEGMPDDIIYRVTKAMYENAAFLQERLPGQFRTFELKMALDGKGKIPVHPGAMKYYKEKGLL